MINRFLHNLTLRQFEIDSNILQNLLRLFYGVFATLISVQILTLFRRDDLEGLWLWPVSWLYFIDVEFLKLTLAGLSLLSLGFLLGAAILPHIRAFRTNAFLFTFLFLAARYSFGKIDHGYYGFMFASFWFMFLSVKKKGPSPKARVWDSYGFFATQLSVLGLYSLSGVWKLRELIHAVRGEGWFSLDPVMSTLSWARIQSHFKISPVLELDFSSDISRILWLLVILFETFCFAVAWLPGLQRYFGVALVLFHFLVAGTMDVHFQSAQMLAVILFVAHPYKKRGRD